MGLQDTRESLDIQQTSMEGWREHEYQLNADLKEIAGFFYCMSRSCGGHIEASGACDLFDGSSDGSSMVLA